MMYGRYRKRAPQILQKRREAYCAIYVCTNILCGLAFIHVHVDPRRVTLIYVHKNKKRKNYENKEKR